LLRPFAEPTAARRPAAGKVDWRYHELLVMSKFRTWDKSSTFTTGDCEMRGLTFTAMLAIGIFSAMAAVAGQEKPKYTTKQIMELAHSKKLLNKILAGQGNAEDKAKLLELYTALARNKPKKGDLDSWKAKATALVKAAKSGDRMALQRAANCKACHSAHK
jgi:hypothetical protein